MLQRLGVVPHGARGFVLADGRRVELGFGRTWMRLEGREEISPVVFQEEGAQPLLGAVTLEIFGLGIDRWSGGSSRWRRSGWRWRKDETAGGRCGRDIHEMESH